jgi:hypothetical protein
MIQAKELRVGNKVGINLKLYPNNYFTVLEIGSTMKLCEIGSEHTQDYFYIADIEPIHLSSEILEKIGFEQLPHFTIQNSWFKKLGRDRVLSIVCVGTPNEMVFVCEEVPPEVKNIIVVRNYDYDGKTYLHHIQNIYSDFTNGKELEINGMYEK